MNLIKKLFGISEPTPLSMDVYVPPQPFNPTFAIRVRWAITYKNTSNGINDFVWTKCFNDYNSAQEFANKEIEKIYNLVSNSSEFFYYYDMVIKKCDFVKATAYDPHLLVFGKSDITPKEIIILPGGNATIVKTNNKEEIVGDYKIIGNVSEGD